MGRDRNQPMLGDIQAFDGTGWRPTSLAAAFALLPSVSFVDSILSIVDDVDATKALKFQVGTQATGLTTTIDVGVQTGSYSATLPVMPSSSIFAMSASALTSGRLPYATTGGLLLDSANLTFDGTNFAHGGSGTFATGTGIATFNCTTNSTNDTTGGVILLGGLGLKDAKDIGIGTTTGSKIGQASSKIGFFGATPVVVPTSTTDLRTALINLGLYTTGGASPLNLNGGAFTTSGTIITTGTTPSTSTSTGSAQNGGGYAAGRASFFRGLAGSSDSSALNLTYFSNQSVDPAAYRSALEINHTSNSATAGNSGSTTGLYAQLINQTAGITWTVAKCFEALVSTTNATAANTSAYGFYFNNGTNTGTCTEKAAFYTQAVSGGTTNYAFKSAGAGLIRIGDTTDSTTISDGSFNTLGGASITKALWVGGLGNIAGALTVGGVFSVNNNEIRHNATAPQQFINETDGSLDNKKWEIVVNGEVWKLRLVNDAENVVTDIISITRSTTTVGTITFAGATTQAFNWAQTGATTHSTGTGAVSLNGDTTIASGKVLQLGNAYVATPQVTTGYVTLKDSTGTTYKVPCNV